MSISGVSPSPAPRIGVNVSEQRSAEVEKWRRIIENRKKQGRGLTRWESGGKKIV